MNNKIDITSIGAPTYNDAANGQLRGSNIDALIMFSNDLVKTSVDSGTGNITYEVNSFYVPEGLSDFSSVLTQEQEFTRQDIKKYKPVRLPQVTYGQGLFIMSQDDSFEQYFINSVVFYTDNFYIRFGIASWTANQATNPLTDGNQATLSALWSFFDLRKPA